MNRKNYLAPKAEVINVRTYVIAASAEQGNANATKNNEWSNL